ncbi:HlyD family secretion protein [Methylobacterium oryzihabitans]|nr:HlyD family secretion protein [Methylobacterium oryzihabitans]
MLDDQRPGRVREGEHASAPETMRGDDGRGRALREGGDRPDPDDEQTGDAGTQDAKTRDETPRDEGGKRPSVLRRHPWWFVLGGLVVVVLGALGFWYWLVAIHPYESTDDAFVDARQFSVAPKVSGYVVAVPVTDNRHVEAGTVLFQIDPRDYRVALDQAKAQVEAAQASIRNIDAQIEAQQGSVQEARAQVEQAQAALRFAEQDAARYQDLAQRGAGSVQRSQQSTADLQQRQADLSRARAAVTVAQKQIGALEAQRASAVASLAQGRAQVEQAELNLGYTTITAAQAGRVVRLTGAVGQYAQAGQALSMFVPDDIWVTANYKETQITDMRPGQSADIRIDAYPDRTITGTVDSVQPGSGTAFSLLPAENATGNYVKVVQRIPVKITVGNWPTDVAIGPGMSIVPTVRVR